MPPSTPRNRRNAECNMFNPGLRGLSSHDTLPSQSTGILALLKAFLRGDPAGDRSGASGRSKVSRFFTYL